MARKLSVWRLRHRRLLMLFGLLFVTFILINFAFFIEKSIITNTVDNSSVKEANYISQSVNQIKETELKVENAGSLSWYKLPWSVNTTINPLAKPWFMSNGTVRPSSHYVTRHYALWPEDVSPEKPSTDPQIDRIVNQLMYVPQGYNQHAYVPHGRLPLKKILLYYGKNNWGTDLQMGQTRFINDKCPVNSCQLMDNNEKIDQADAVIFKDRFSWPKFGRPLGQLWILFLLEGPKHTQLFSSINKHTFNWTATYRHDSDIVAPYEKFVAYQSLYGDDGATVMPKDVDLFRHSMLLGTENEQTLKNVNFANGKTKKVAIFISNCAAQNKRLEYTRELSKHIEVDIFGSCGNLKCPRSKTTECFTMLNRDYKFYLAFENSNCHDYITEKFFVNSLGHNSDSLNIIPVVMGGSREDYRRSSPPNSFIHVDDYRNPESLARYLHHLDKNDTAYNEYFAWKWPLRSGEFINTYFWCRLCALLHAPPAHRKPTVSYASMAKWWAPKNVCLRGYTRWPTVDAP